MSTITIETDNNALARKLAEFLKSVSSVTSVTVKNSDNQPLTSADWARPGRIATDEELEKMIVAAEEGPFYTTGEVKKRIRKKFKEWKKNNMK